MFKKIIFYIEKTLFFSGLGFPIMERCGDVYASFGSSFLLMQESREGIYVLQIALRHT